MNTFLGLLLAIPGMILSALVYCTVWMLMTGQIRLPSRGPVGWYRARMRRKAWLRSER